MIKKLVFKCLVLALIMVGLSACLDKITIEPADTPTNGYVVQGKLIMGAPSYFRVTVGQLFFYTSNINRPVADAEVSLVAESDGRRITLTNQDLSNVYDTYLEPSEFPVQPGDRYRVEVLLRDDNVIISEWETILPTPKATSLGWRYKTIERVNFSGEIEEVTGLEYIINTPLQNNEGETVALRWSFVDAYRITDNLDDTCYVENSFRSGDIFLFDGRSTSLPALTDFPLLETTINQKHIEGYYLSAFQQALSPSAYGYWQQVATLAEREGTVFDNPAGEISTNMRSIIDSTLLVHGFFTAASQDTIRLFISREDMGNLPFHCPRPPTGTGLVPASICDNCQEALGSSLTPPDYWEE